MQYYKSDLWEKMQHSETSKEATEQWALNDKMYSEYFNKIEKYLPRGFIKIFYNEHGFHDFTINEICIKSIQRKTKPNYFNVLLKISSGNKCYEIILRNAEISKVNICNTEYCLGGRMM